MAVISWTYNVTDSSDSSALEGVNIWASSDLGGQLVLDTGVTDASGNVTLSLEDASDVYIWHSLNGYTFTNPNLQTSISALIPGSGTGAAVVAPVPEPIVLGVTARDIVSDALMECGILAQGEDAQAEDADTGLNRLNRLLEEWKTERRYAYTINIATYTLTASQAVHTIGPSGDFVADRPVRITKANLLLTDQSPTYHSHLTIIESADEWAKINTPGLATYLPSHLYCDYGFPDASLYLYPVCTAAYDLELFTWQQLSQFTSLDYQVSLPPGYYNALMYSLAEKLCTPFGVAVEVRGIISADARMARHKIAGVNVRAPRISLLGQGLPTTGNC